MNQSVIYYNAGECGSGKTKWAVGHMAANPGRYIYAVDRVDEFGKRMEKITEVSQEVHTACQVRTLSSREVESVVQSFPLAIDEYSHRPHVVLIVTHEALKLVDHSVVEGRGWQLIIDEDPKLWASATLDLGVSAPFWEHTYNLETLAPGYSRISHKADAPTWREMQHDVLTRPIAAFHDRVRKRDVVVNLSGDDAWEDLKTRGRLTYFMVWDIRELLIYDRVTVLANSFDKLVSFRLIQALYPEVDLVHFSIGPKEVWLPRDVTINYVTDTHRAGSHFFGNTEQGKAAVAAWTAWVKPRVDADLHYYAANLARGDLDLPGEKISPKIAGSNKYRFHTQCSVLYSAKASRAENAVFASLTGGAISAEDVMRDREFEDLVQIVYRSSLRMHNDPRPVTVNVYDREQAEFIASYFETTGFPFRTKTVLHDLGLSYEKEKPGPKVNPDKPRMTSTERSRACRARKAAEKAKAA